MVVQTDTFDCDVAIVGAGIAGALIGWELASQGAKVVFLEARDRSKVTAQSHRQLFPGGPSKGLEG